ncbi:uncharacterized protein LOC108673440 isoform X2 [Hyalella azteca]|uniref:Uncharacterized protein LOC108673440 isoform X2 n=1 Tax=Hyalella azteca TaxID=294128 RepID=A0A979FXK6_HYAAZ|nr:uncharacterized protein LOC108673440 isoform X2 [Hyalella azteca]
MMDAKNHNIVQGLMPQYSKYQPQRSLPNNYPSGQISPHNNNHHQPITKPLHQFLAKTDTAPQYLETPEQRKAEYANATTISVGPDFWARRTAQRASEAMRAASHMTMSSGEPGGRAMHSSDRSESQPASRFAAAPTTTTRPIVHQSSTPSALTSPYTRPSGRSATPPGRSSSEDRERRRRKRRATSDSESGSRRSGGRAERTSSRASARRASDAGDNLPTNFRAAVTEFAPPMPPALLRKLEIKEVNGLGKIRVVLRISPLVRLLEHEAAVLCLDKKRRQVTLVDPLAPPPRDTRLGVVAPKMFAFDQVYSQDDAQSDVVSGATVDVLHAVLAGNDGCILCFGGSLLGKSYTMVGLHGAQQQLGIMPSCVAWLYAAIARLKANAAVRFSVRVSAVAVDATGANVKDLLAQSAYDGGNSPISAPRDGVVGGGVLSSLCELRAPTAETAAHYLDVALAGRSSLALSSVLQQQQQKQQGAVIFPGSATLVYSLHIYQYAVDKNGKGGVVGGRSRLHMIDVGDMSARHGSNSMSLTSLTSVLLAIFDGQKYLPHRENKLTGVLREALNSLTCHTALVVHVSPAARHAHHNLTTLQLAARVHRTRRKKIRGMTGSGSSGSSGSRKSSGGETSAGSSSLDFSSSDQSCDTVIYIGGGGPGDSTDGEHPPIFMSHHIRQPRPLGLQRLRSLEQLRAQSASPTPSMRRTASASPTPTSRSVPNGKPFFKRKPCPPPRTVSNNSLNYSNNNSPMFHPLHVGFIRHQPGVSQIHYPATGQTKKPFLSTFKPFSTIATSRQNNNVHSKSLEDNLNVVNGNQSPMSNFGSTDKLPNHKAYQEPNNLVPTALSPNQEFSNVQNMRYYQLTQQQLHQQQLFNEHCLREQRKVLEQAASTEHQPAIKPQLKTISASVIPSQNPNVEISRNGKQETPSDEQWIDGPRVHKSRVVASRNNGRSEQQDETWVDGPQMSTQSNGTQVSAATSSAQPGTYGFMDDHKKSMIEKWVEVQTAQVVNQITGKVPPQSKHALNMTDQNITSDNKTEFSNKNDTKDESVPLTHLTQFRVCDESTNGSDVDTLSEDPSASGVPPLEQPSLIEELVRKNFIPSGCLEIFDDRSKAEPSLDHIQISSADETNKIVSDGSTKGRGSPETTSLGGELSIDEVCSQCEALAEECEELSSLLSCEEEECKRQAPQGLATVLEEPELESAVAAEEAEMRAADIAHPDPESELDCLSKMDTLKSSRAGGDDGNEADEESSEFGSLRKPLSQNTKPGELARNVGLICRTPAEDGAKHVVYRKRCIKRTSTSSDTNDHDCVVKCDGGKQFGASSRTPPEMLMIDLPAYPVVSVDCGTQVNEKDLMSTSVSSGSSSDPNTSIGDDHPLRVLSEENLTCASNFTDSYSQMGETGGEEDSDGDSRPFSLLEVTEYAKLGQALSNNSSNKNLRELAKIHALYMSLAQPNSNISFDDSQLQPSSLLEILASSRDSLIEQPKPEVDYESISSDFVSAVDLKVDCDSCNKTKHGSEASVQDEDTNKKSTCQLTSNPMMPRVGNCICDTQPCSDTLPSMFSNWHDSEKGSHYSLMKNRSETSVNLCDFNTLEMKDPGRSVDVARTDRVPINGVPVPHFIEDSDASIVLRNTGQYSKYSLSKIEVEVPQPSVKDHHSDNESDCVSNISDDSDYVIRTSKFSKFLCVGVGRTKSKTPYKIAKTNFKNESKKNSKMKDGSNKIKFQSSKNQDDSNPPEFGSKNALKSPSKAPSQNLSKSSSSGSSNSSAGTGWKSDASSGLVGGRWISKGNAYKGTSYNASNFGTSSSFSYETAPAEGYDSGNDSGITLERTIREKTEPSWNTELNASTGNPKRLPIQPSIPTKSGTSSSIGTTPSLGESSGYGSMARDSECSSFSSSQDSEMDEEHKRERQRARHSSRLPSVQVQTFTEEDIQRYESRSRTAECLQLQKEQRSQMDIAALKSRQEKLKLELAEAKNKLNIPDKSWSYERKSNFT